MKGHCRHCTDACKATRVLSGNPSIIHANGDGVRWGSGQCHACAEAERIAGVIEAEAEIWDTIARDAFNDGDPCLDAYDSDAKARALKEAAAIARGET